MAQTVFVGCSSAHRNLITNLSQAARSNAEILITGPTGVGKEICARLAHEQSHRAAAPFVAVNCGALPPDLFENELFGHVGGAFTGASQRAGGLVGEAETGTLFLDELEALHLANQVKLLRLIQEKEYRPLGHARARKVDIRFMAASNRNLVEEARAGRFRSDLLFRLRVLSIDIPPLASRREDIPVLLEHFLSRYSAEYGVERVSLTPEAMDRLLSYSWPGNVRELENCVRSLLCTRAGRLVDAEELPLLAEEVPSVAADGPSSPGACPPRSGEPLSSAKRRIVGEFERSYLESMLAQHRGNIAAAARASGKNRRAFFELMRRHSIDAQPFRVRSVARELAAVPRQASRAVEDDEGIAGSLRSVAGTGR